jgi:hypothetical protein
MPEYVPNSAECVTRSVRGLTPVPGPPGRYRCGMSQPRLRLSARGVLFVVLALGLIGIAVGAAAAGVWAVAAAAATIGAWMADLALRDLGVRHRA